LLPLPAGNFPINQVVDKLSAVLATACSIIIKVPEVYVNTKFVMQGES